MKSLYFIRDISGSIRVVTVIVCFIFATLLALSWWFTDRCIIRITNQSGRNLSSITIVIRDGVKKGEMSTRQLSNGQSEWMVLTCAGHCSYFLRVRFEDESVFETVERSLDGPCVVSEKVGLTDSRYE